ncbi:hypothetical protein KUV39_08805 [Phaeobacter italicus]|uniref:hypothetical protein n=1 Tax=Phaeobacter italicus TaxID=481446 RepID=UPI001C93A798|nr:hypothetical protein [Phaeobacter italicus]MBY5976745.1 hypothetical protein [Phaeobacter italicus]
MFKSVLATLLIMPVAASAEYRKLNAQEIQRVLGGQELIYEDGTQRFDLSGQTKSMYDDGTYFGSWGLSGDRYCQKFREADGWQCYTVLKDAERIRFKGDDGTYWTGELVD